jgi:hypothetical protein
MMGLFSLCINMRAASLSLNGHEATGRETTNARTTSSGSANSSATTNATANC